MRYSINFHKATTILYLLGLMHYFDNFTIGPCVYLSLHGTYIIIWFCKELSFPDSTWGTDASFVKSLAVFLFLGPFGYWIPPYILVSSHHQPRNLTIAISISTLCLGIFLHFCSDCQKYYTLKYHRGLITEGLFARSRNCNYLGEIFIYLSFGLLAEHWISIVIVTLFSVLIYYPSMRRKEASLSRYPGFAKYKEKSGFLLPKIF